MRLPRLFVLLLAAAAAIAFLRRRARAEYVDVHFDDGSTIRLTGGPERRELIADAYAVLDTVA
jgi:hypothetical protein